jgi:integral membrane sensor domain MASE1
MNWLLILSLSLFGVLIGLLSIFGITEGKEWWMWAIVVLVSALAIGLKAPGKYFKHGFLTSLISGVISSIFQYVFYDTYVANNATFAAQLSQMPEGFNMRITMLAGGPIGGALAGVVLGGLAVLMAKILGRTAEVSPVAPPAEQGQSDITPR